MNIVGFRLVFDFYAVQNAGSIDETVDLLSTKRRIINRPSTEGEEFSGSLSADERHYCCLKCANPVIRRMGSNKNVIISIR